MAYIVVGNNRGPRGLVGPPGPDWFKGSLTSTSNLDTIANGLYFVPSNTVAVALGLPGGTLGFLETRKSGAYGQRLYRPWGAVGMEYVSRHTTAGWEPWNTAGMKPIRLLVQIHGNFTWDALADGWYFNDNSQLQSLWNLPVQVGEIRKGTHAVGYGLAEMREWAPPHREWINRRTTAGWQGWEPKQGGGGGGSDLAIGTLIAQQNMDLLPDGWWNAPNAGVAQSLGLPGNLPGFLLQTGINRQYTNRNGIFVSTKGTTTWGTWAQAGVKDGYTPLQPPTGLPWLQEDALGSGVMMLDQDHHGTGYAINTQNFPGANAGWVLHQYSNASSAMIIDNCRSQSAIQINNTQNSTITPDYKGDGDFFQLGPWDDTGNYSRWFTLTNGLEFRNDTRKTPSFNQVWGTGDVIEYKVNGVVKGKFTSDGCFAQSSPDGSLWKIVISNSGAISTVKL